MRLLLLLAVGALAWGQFVTVISYEYGGTVTTFIAVNLPPGITNYTLPSFNVLPLQNASGFYVFVAPSTASIAVLYNGTWFNGTSAVSIASASVGDALIWVEGQGPYVYRLSPTALVSSFPYAAIVPFFGAAMIIGLTARRKLDVSGAAFIVLGISMSLVGPIFGIPPHLVTFIGIMMIVAGVLIWLFMRKGE